MKEDRYALIIKGAVFGHYLVQVPFPLKEPFKLIFQPVFSKEKKAWLVQFHYRNDLEQFAKQYNLKFIDMTTPDQVNRFQLPVNIKKKDDARTGLPYNSTLYPFQRVGIKFLSSDGNKIIADEMGLGKTVQIFSAIKESGAKSYIIVTPNSLKFTWQNEIRKWMPKESVAVADGPKNKRKEILLNNDKVIINYAMLTIKDYTDILKKKQYDVAVFDESTYLKNIKAQRTQGALLINAKKKILATGTPITKTPADLFAQLQILYPDVYTSYWNFVKKYCYMKKVFVGRRSIIKVYGLQNEDILTKEIDPILIRRTQKEVVQFLPDIVEEQITLPISDLPKEQKKIYSNLWDKFAQYAEQRKRNETLGALTQLQEVLETPINYGIQAESLKIRSLMELVDTYDTESNNFVIWTKFVKSAKYISELLNKSGRKSTFISGDVPSKDREERINKFKNNKVRFLVSTLAVGKFGYSFVVPDRPVVSIFVSRSFSFDEMAQAKMRVKRLNTTETPVVLYLHVVGSIDDYIKHVLDTKQDIFEVVFNRFAKNQPKYSDRSLFAR
jgi:SNF2 family DNA or RNA helicase